MEWINTSERFVAFFDIMGFKNLVQTKKHEDIALTMAIINNHVLALESEARELLEDTDNDFFNYNNIDLSNMLDKKNNDAVSSKVEYSIVRPVIFSDSILIVSNTDTLADAIKITLAAKFIIDICFKNGIPIKGAIAHGKFTADYGKSIFFGNPLIDAYLLQENLLIYGCICHHSFELFLKNHHVIIERDIQSVYKHLISILPVPLRSKTVSHAILNMKGKSKNIEELRNIIVNLYYSVSGETRKYVDNTLEIFDKQYLHPKSKKGE